MPPLNCNNQNRLKNCFDTQTQVAGSVVQVTSTLKPSFVCQPGTYLRTVTASVTVAGAPQTMTSCDLMVVPPGGGAVVTSFDFGNPVANVMGVQYDDQPDVRPISGQTAPSPRACGAVVAAGLNFIDVAAPPNTQEAYALVQQGRHLAVVRVRRDTTTDALTSIDVLDAVSGDLPELLP